MRKILFLKHLSKNTMYFCAVEKAACLVIAEDAGLSRRSPRKRRVFIKLAHATNDRLIIINSRMIFIWLLPIIIKNTQGFLFIQINPT